MAGSADTAGGAAVASDEDSEEQDRMAAEVEWVDCTKKGKTLLCHHCQARVDGGGRRHGQYYCWPCISTVSSVRRFLGKGARVDLDPVVGTDPSAVTQPLRLRSRPREAAPSQGGIRVADLHEIPGPVQVDGHAADASAGSVDRRGEQFEGVWIREGDGQEMCSISGNTLVWSAMCPGLTTVVTVLSECKIEIELEIDGAYVKHCASLESDAKRGQRLLQWSNGETWVESPGKLWVESPKRGKRLLVWGVPGPDSRRGSASRKKRKGSSGGDATQVP